MTVSWSFCWSFWILHLLLALKVHTTQSAPDFSRKCSVFDINYCFVFLNADRLLLRGEGCAKLDLHSLIFLHILLSKQLMQLMLTDQNQGEEAAEKVLIFTEWD